MPTTQIPSPPALSRSGEARLAGLLSALPALREGYFWERRLHWAESHLQTRGQPQILRTAQAFAHVLDNMTIDIGGHELIVGRHPKGEPDAGTRERMDRALEAWGGHGLQEWALAQIPDPALKLWHGGVFTTGSKTGHMTPDHEGLLRRGLGERLRHIALRLDSIDPGLPDAGERRTFLLAAQIACEAASRFLSRYADLAAELAGESSCPRRGSELQVISESCRHLSTGPARTFHEAVQLSWLLHLWVCIENGESAAAFAPGRVDRYLHPYLEQDLQDGRLTEAEAYELLLCSFIKLNEIGDDLPQSAVLGGMISATEDGCNRLTELCLAASERLGMLNPALVLRVNDRTPRPVLAQAARLLRTGIGFPQLYNDRVTIHCLRQAGCRAPDAREYCIGGCVELTVQGRSNPWVGNFLNLPKCLLLALNHGVCTLCGDRLGADTPPPAEMTTFEDVAAAFRSQLRYAIEQMAYCENVFDRAQARCTPFPFLSANILDCIEQARDISAGGARYNFTELQGVGLANTADSLAAIRSFVYEQRKLSLSELVEVLNDDWAGAETLRRELLRDGPKYGTGDGGADEIAKQVVAWFTAEVGKYHNPRGGRFRPGLLVWTLGDGFGQMTGATPDGRKSGAVLADSVGPAQGRDRKGPTAVIASVTSIDYSPMVGGLALNMKFTPECLATDEGIEKFVDLLLTYFEAGGMQMQVNVVDGDLLRRAQEEPDLYADLIVRVSGWSARFLTLSTRLQDEIISRTEQKL